MAQPHRFQPIAHLCGRLYHDWGPTGLGLGLEFESGLSGLGLDERAVGRACMQVHEQRGALARSSTGVVRNASISAVSRAACTAIAPVGISASRNPDFSRITLGSPAPRYDFETMILILQVGWLFWRIQSYVQLPRAGGLKRAE